MIQLFWQSDIVTKAFVIGLLLMSVISWTVFFCKFAIVKLTKRHLRKVLNKLKGIEASEQLIDVARDYSGTVPGYCLSQNLTFFKGVLEVQTREQISVPARQWDFVQDHIDQSVELLVEHQESYLPILSTIAAVSPLIGLFGTIYGLVHAFENIGKQQMADISTVAPGIAEALITTLVGLFVAIPALIMYNYLATQVRKIEQQLYILADRMAIIMHRSMPS